MWERLAHRQEFNLHSAQEVINFIHFAIRTCYPIPPVIQNRIYLKPIGNFILQVVKCLLLIIKIILKNTIVLCTLMCNVTEVSDIQERKQAEVNGEYDAREDIWA